MGVGVRQQTKAKEPERAAGSPAWLDTARTRVWVHARACGCVCAPLGLSAAFLCPVFALARAGNCGTCSPTLPVPPSRSDHAPPHGRGKARCLPHIPSVGWVPPLSPQSPSLL